MIDIDKLSPQPKNGSIDISKLVPEEKETKYIAPTYSPIEGKHNINVADYSSYLPEGVFDSPTLEESRAQRQSSIEKLSKGLVNTTTQLVFDTVKNASYLFDWEQIGDLVKGKEGEFTNWMADLMDKDKEATKLDVYRTKASLGFHPESSGWWADALPDLASTLSMVFPATAAVKGLGLAGKALGGAKLLTKLGIGAEAVEGVSGAVLSRYMENTMEAYQTVQDTYQTAIQKGASEEVAKKAAGEAGRKNWALNSIMVLQDIPQYMLLVKGFKGAGSILSKKGLKEIGKQFALEGSEEAYQFSTDKETKRSALINNKVTPDDNTDFTDRLLDYSKDGDFWTATFLGGLGGGIFATHAVHQNNKAQQQFTSLLSAYKGILTNDKATFNRGMDIGFNEAITSAVATRTLDKLQSDIQTIATNPQRIEDNEEKHELLTNSKKILDNIEYAKQIHPTIFNDETLTPELKKLKFGALLNQRTSQQRLTEINSHISTLSTENTGLAPDLVLYKNIKLTIEELQNNPVMQNKVKELKNNLNSATKDLLLAHPEFKTIQELEKSLIGTNDDQLKQALANKEIEESIIDQTKDILVKLKQSESKQEIIEIIKKKKQR
ncbi:MAG: hypothetical protein WD512_15650, partial [Candidatus Paceibacterota bacterium]